MERLIAWRNNNGDPVATNGVSGEVGELSADNVEEQFRGQTLIDLRARCKDFALPVNGNKETVVKRLTEKWLQMKAQDVEGLQGHARGGCCDRMSIGDL